jgi:hypothetical protein
MKDLFFMGGPLFMSILTILLIIMVTWMVFHIVSFYNSSQVNHEKALRFISYGKSIGLFAMITGILGQLIGFYSAFIAIERAGDISPSLVFGGIKVSLITTLYGIFIYLFSIIIWFLASVVIERMGSNK